jgi:hypothetical protein
MGPRGPIRPSGPIPPRDPAFPPPPGPGPRPGGGTGRHAGGTGYATAAGYRPGRGRAGPSGPADVPESFDGGYAKVMRAPDHPVRSASARPPNSGPAGDPGRPSGSGRRPDPARRQDPARSAPPPADVYVYRDTDGLPGDCGPASPGPGENDPAYWYDLTGTGTGAGDFPGPGVSGVSGGSGDSGGTSRVLGETRGPFEPLVSSAGQDQGAGPAGPAGIARERKLEQIRDLYLTAEAIGEANVDKHFDQLLAQQRELISEYFKQSGAARSAPDAADTPLADQLEAERRADAEGRPATEGWPTTEGQAATEPDTRPASGPGGTPEGARVAADQPRAS